jgi:predicted metalloprotease with PDZ domain
MINYRIFSENPHSHFLNIEMTIANINTQFIDLQLPAWRPGRYELQNFAKNVQRFEVFSEEGKPLPFQKITKDCWRIQSDNETVVLKMTYFANVQNAGSSFVDTDVMYVNFVNCLPYVDGRMDENCEVEIQLGQDYKFACGIVPTLSENAKWIFSAKDYYQIVDCPMLASPYLQSKQYNVKDTEFTVWFLGNYKPNWKKIMTDFQCFSEKQIEVMGDFPEKDYHFINWILPTAYYHGVEHRNSTMIVLGPDSEGDNLYSDLLGISSHELFHAWNICKIRPTEMLPYNFTKENYFPTGFVAEGVTTYFGDLFLKQTDIFTLEEYMKELGATLKRHFEEDGKAFQSLIESSYDLWLDGYVKPIPNRRVSIYQKGAVVALILDLEIRLKTQHSSSLETVMKLMWEQFGKPYIGYSLKDYQTIAEKVYGESLTWYFEECVAGNSPLEERLRKLLAQFGIELQSTEDGKLHLELVDSQNKNLKEWLE